MSGWWRSLKFSLAPDFSQVVIGGPRSPNRFNGFSNQKPGGSDSPRIIDNDFGEPYSAPSSRSRITPAKPSHHQNRGPGHQ